jgi:hypothetical protein
VIPVPWWEHDFELRRRRGIWLYLLSMDSTSLKKLTAHRDDRRFRELYRYFQPANPAALLHPHYFPSREQDLSTNAVEGASHALASQPSLSNVPVSPNATLTSFAQLACVQLQVQRALIW